MKKLLIILILLFSLNISFNTGYITISRQRTAIVNIINYEDDKLTTSTIDKTKRALIEMYICLLLEVKTCNRVIINDTS